MLFLNKIKPILLDVYMPEELEGYDVVCKTGNDKKPFMKPNKNKFGDISSCFGLVEMQKRSLTIKAWQQIDVIQDDNQIKFEPANDQYFGSELHTHQTCGFAEKENIEVIKIAPPIAITCNESMNFLYTASPFAYHPLNIISGINNLKYNCQTNVFIYFEKGKKLNYTLKPLSPLMHIVPLSDRPIKLNYIYDWQKTVKMLSVKKYQMFKKNKMYRRMKLLG